MATREMRNIESVLDENEHRYRLLLENASLGIFISDPKGRYLMVNPAGCALLGYSEQELLQMNLQDIIAKDELAKHPVPFDKLLAGQEIQSERQLRRKDGSLLTVEIAARLLPDGNLQGIVKDVTDRKEIESRLKASEERFRTLVEQSPLSTVIYGVDGNMIMFNRAACELWNLSEEQATFLLNNYNILQDEQLEAQGLMPYVKRGFAGESVNIPILEYVPNQPELTYGKTPTKQWVRGFIYPVKDHGGHIREIVVLHEDVTERQRIEEMLRQTQKQDSLSILAGGVAHDFNNLLVAILGQITLAQAKLPSASPARDHIKKAVSAAEHAADLTRQLLAYSGKGRFEVTAVNLNALIQNNLHLFEASIPKQIRLRLSPALDLPPVEVDIGQMQQLIMNLIINGSEAIGNRPGTVSISTSVTEFETVDAQLWQYTGKVLAPGRYVTTIISDDGKGMDSKTLCQIFDPFFTTKETGRGLGLAAVLGIVRGLNGGLTVESLPGQGTTFRLYFPASEKNEPDSAATLAAAKTKPLGQSGLVLVIDDEKAVRQAVVDILALEGLSTITAVSGEKGIEIYRERQAEILLVLLDLSMPGLNGIDTLIQLKEINPEVKVLLSSGYSQEELIQRYNRPDFAGFLQKPYSANHLVHVIRSLLY